MNTEIFLVRHAKSDAQHKDEESRPLTREGKAASKRLINVFEKTPIGAIYSSPYLRAIETVKPVSIKKGLLIEIKDEFRERSVGTWFREIEEFDSFVGLQWKTFVTGSKMVNRYKKRRSETYSR